MKTVYLFLLLIVVIITVLVFQKIQSSVEEGFNSKKKDVPPANIYQPLSCPQGMSSYQAMGHTICCKGDTTGNKCDTDACYLASTGQIDPLENGTLPCGMYLFNLQKENSEKFCNTSMPHYYRDSKTGDSGCASEIVSDYSAPTPSAIDAKKVCKIYKNETDTNEKIDSCLNMAMAYKLQTSKWCKRAKCQVSVIVPPDGKGPALIQSTYKNPADTSTTGTGTPNPAPLTCYSKESGLRYVQTIFTGDLYDRIVNGINAGTEPWVCGYKPKEPNCMVKYVGANHPAILTISQLVVRNLKGVNITPLAKIHQETTEALIEGGNTFSATFATDGNESVRTIPSLYISNPRNEKGKARPGNFVLEFNPPVCVSSIVYYGNNFYPPYNAGVTFRLYSSKPEIIWTSSLSTTKDIQTFPVDTKLYDPK
jgi:hypothetical protein